MKKEKQKKLINILRAVLYIVAIFEIFYLFLLFPKRDPELMLEFNGVKQLIDQYCKPDQYYFPMPFISVKFDNLSTEELAFCRKQLNGYSLVFDKKYWYIMLSHADRRQLMAHEMMHCLFGQPHVDNEKHFMAPYFYSLSEEELQTQLVDYLNLKCNNNQ